MTQESAKQSLETDTAALQILTGDHNQAHDREDSIRELLSADMLLNTAILLLKMLKFIYMKKTISGKIA